MSLWWLRRYPGARSWCRHGTCFISGHGTHPCPASGIHRLRWKQAMA